MDAALHRSVRAERARHRAGRPRRRGGAVRRRRAPGGPGIGADHPCLGPRSPVRRSGSSPTPHRSASPPRR